MTKAALIRLLEPAPDDADVVVNVVSGDDITFAAEVQIESVTAGVWLEQATLEVIL